MALKRLAVDIPEELHNKLKAASAMCGITIRDVIIELINKWLQTKGAIDERQPDARH